MKIKTFFWVCGILFLGFISSDLYARTWTIQGKPYEGDFLRYSDEKIVLLLPVENELSVPLEQFSKEDQEFLEKFYPKSDKKFKSAEEEKESKPNVLLFAEHGLCILLAVAFLTLILKFVFSKKVSREQKKSTENLISKVPETMEPFPYIGPVLNGERFSCNSEMVKKAQKEADAQAARFLDVFKMKYYDDLSSTKKIPSRSALQTIADYLNPEFTQKICDHDSYWISKIYGQEEKIPSGLASYIENLLPPIQVPEGVQIRLEAAPWAVGILAAIGAIAGAWLVCAFASTSGMKSPSDISVLVGATLGSGLLSLFIFWVTANEVWRKRLLAIIGITAAVDVVLTTISTYLSWGRFFGIGRKIQGTLWKRILLYLATFAVLMMMKRPVVFDSGDYEKRLATLYYERIVAIVMLLALYKTQHQHLVEEQEKWDNEKNRLEAIANGNKTTAKSVESIIPRIQSLWTVDISQLAPMMKALVQDFKSVGFDLPSKPMPWFSQIPQSTNPVQKESASKTFRWSSEKRAEYETLGLLDEGDEVEILEEPIFMNERVIKKGLVQETR